MVMHIVEELWENEGKVDRDVFLGMVLAGEKSSPIFIVPLVFCAWLLWTAVRARDCFFAFLCTQRDGPPLRDPFASEVKLLNIVCWQILLVLAGDRHYDELRHQYDVDHGATEEVRHKSDCKDVVCLRCLSSCMSMHMCMHTSICSTVLRLCKDQWLKTSLQPRLPLRKE